MLVITVLLVIYVMNIFKNGRVKKNDRVLWLILLFMGSSIAMLFYWYLFIWKEPSVKKIKS